MKNRDNSQNMFCNFHRRTCKRVNDEEIFIFRQSVPLKDFSEKDLPCKKKKN